MTANYVKDPTMDEAMGRYYDWARQRKPLNWFLIAQERERAESIGDRNTLRVIREIINHRRAA